MLKKKVVLFWEMFYSGIQSHNSKTQKVIRKEIQKVRKVRKTQDTLSCVKSCINKWWSGRNVAKGKKKKKSYVKQSSVNDVGTAVVGKGPVVS